MHTDEEKDAAFKAAVQKQGWPSGALAGTSEGNLAENMFYAGYDLAATPVLPATGEAMPQNADLAELQRRVKEHEGMPCLPCFVRPAGDYDGWCLVGEADRGQDDAKYHSMDFATFGDESLARLAAAALNTAATRSSSPLEGSAADADGWLPIAVRPTTSRIVQVTDKEKKGIAWATCQNSAYGNNKVVWHNAGAGIFFDIAYWRDCGEPVEPDKNMSARPTVGEEGGVGGARWAPEAEERQRPGIRTRQVLIPSTDYTSGWDRKPAVWMGDYWQHASFRQRVELDVRYVLVEADTPPLPASPTTTKGPGQC